MSAQEHREPSKADKAGLLAGAGALITALCCALGPAAVAVGAGTAVGSVFGIAAALIVVLAVYLVVRRRRACGGGCG